MSAAMPARRAPERERGRDHERERHPTRVGFGDRAELEHEKALHFVGKRGGDVVHVSGDRGRVGDQPVDRDERDERGYEREERVERDAGRDQGEVVVAYAFGELRRDGLGAAR